MNRNILKILFVIACSITTLHLQIVAYDPFMTQYICLNKTGQTLLYDENNEDKASQVALPGFYFVITTDNEDLNLLTYDDWTAFESKSEKGRFQSVEIPSTQKQLILDQKHLIIKLNPNKKGHLKAILDPQYTK